MLLFSTLLRVVQSMTKEDFIQLAIDWNQGSPHEENVIPDLRWHGERNIRWGNERMWMAVEEYRNRDIVAIRYEQNKNGVIWGTDYVLNFKERKLSIRLDRSYAEGALVFDPSFSTPHFITMLISEGWLESDEQLEVTREPLYITEDSIDLLASIINRKIKCRLPVVYVSRRQEGGFPLDLDDLALRLKGIAHVLAEGEGELSSRLQKLCGGHHEYDGAVGVYYPGLATPGNGGHVRYLDHTSGGLDEEQTGAIVREITAYTNAQRVDPLYTWMGVRSSILFDRLVSQREERIAAEAARDQATQEADELISSIDDEISSLKRQITDLANENEALRCENIGLHGRLETTKNVPVLCYGKEKDFYQNEIRNLLLVALNEIRKTTPQNTRKHHVLRDVISANGGAEAAEAVFQKREATLKRLFNAYTGMTSPMRQELKQLGFTITEDGKHYKLTYYNDGRYWSAIAKTPSDWRGGKNDAMRLIRIIQ